VRSTRASAPTGSRSGRAPSGTRRSSARSSTCFHGPRACSTSVAATAGSRCRSRAPGTTLVGLDLSEPLVAAARLAAAEAGLSIAYDVGSMCELPYGGESFDAAVCLWSAFAELLAEPEQIAAVAELSRVLRPGGFALVEGPCFRPPTDAEIASGARGGAEHRIAHGLVEGIPAAHYVHDARSLARVCHAAGVERFDVFEGDWAGRQRLFLRIDVPDDA
jgi:SAM-dependent methyltransferase